MFGEILTVVKDRMPLVHSITNYVTVNDCANCILAVGGSPIMSDDIAEVEEIVSICNALVINIGTLTSRSIESMIVAGKKANTLGIPVVLDPVGNGASSFRTNTIKHLLNEIKFTVIRGNISEIIAIAKDSSSIRGVDASASDIMSIDDQIAMAKDISKNTGAVVAISGKTDVIANANNSYVINNGCYEMSKITGTGCMLTAIIGTFCGAHGAYLEATTCAIAMMGIAGQRAKEKMQGTSSFRMHLIDELSNINQNIINEEIKLG